MLSIINSGGRNGKKKNFRQAQIVAAVGIAYMVLHHTWIEIHEGVDPTSNQDSTTTTSVILSTDDVPQYTGADTIEINGGRVPLMIQKCTLKAKAGSVTVIWMS